MKKLKQPVFFQDDHVNFVDNKNYPLVNSFATCISCLMDLDKVIDINEVEELAKLDGNKAEWLPLTNRIINKIGYNLYHRFTKHKPYDNLFYIVGGRDPRFPDLFHFCIYKSGQLYYDPHPSGSGILTEELFYTIEPILDQSDIDIDDYSSFSSTVSKLQGDEADGKRSMIMLVEKFFESEDRVKELQSQLDQARAHSSFIKGGIDNIAKHLSISYPMMLVTSNSAYAIGEMGVSKVPNVF